MRKHSNSSDSAVSILVADYDPNHDAQFLKTEAVPYFTSLFQDIACRGVASSGKNYGKSEYIDKPAFCVFTRLPGIINDRFFDTFERTRDELIKGSCFVRGLSKVYMGSF